MLLIKFALFVEAGRKTPDLSPRVNTTRWSIGLGAYDLGFLRGTLRTTSMNEVVWKDGVYGYLRGRWRHGLMKIDLNCLLQLFFITLTLRPYTDPTLTLPHNAQLTTLCSLNAHLTTLCSLNTHLTTLHSLNAHLTTLCSLNAHLTTLRPLNAHYTHSTPTLPHYTHSTLTLPHYAHSTLG
jgi:hypothetical protein